MAETNTVPFKTVKEYQEYMKGTPDDDRTLRHNPPPTDGMTLSELGQKSDEEILAIINEMGECEKKSDIRVMYCSGYAFSWTELLTIANFRGFKNKTPGQRKVQYSLPDGTSGEEIINKSQEQLNYLLDGVETYVADTLTYVLSYSYEERSQHEATTIGNILLKGVLSEIETDIMVGTSSNPDCENIGLRHSSINEGITVTEILGNSLEKLENSFNDYILDTPIKNV